MRARASQVSGGEDCLERPAIDVTGGVDVAGVALRVGARTGLIMGLLKSY